MIHDLYERINRTRHTSTIGKESHVSVNWSTFAPGMLPQVVDKLAASRTRDLCNANRPNLAYCYNCTKVCWKGSLIYPVGNIVPTGTCMDFYFYLKYRWIRTRGRGSVDRRTFLKRVSHQFATDLNLSILQLYVNFRSTFSFIVPYMMPPFDSDSNSFPFE